MKRTTASFNLNDNNWHSVNIGIDAKYAYIFWSLPNYSNKSVTSRWDVEAGHASNYNVNYYDANTDAWIGAYFKIEGQQLSLKRPNEYYIYAYVEVYGD